MTASKQVCKTALFIAIEHGDPEKVEAIINAYPELVNLRANNSWTPLMFATRYGQLEIIKLLIQNGASLDRNPLHAAHHSQFSNYQVIKYLLEHGVNPNAPNVMVGASSLKLREVVSLLLQHGAVYE